ncbi:MAG: Lipoyl synthase [Puniceicoccaceae bacterium MED-G32]|jgi:lipoic acid synthetase|nr:lipoyl synthase [Puniceicoccaceae bacterium]RPG15920.1 MAG: lipoyl synthase [Opitutales bacterium TMED207]CAI8299642.1 MAG: Lipoyl synthase [Puniceicoccaceae bacterium MED-G32]|tara:strand:+ start:10350 stop:11237 length:888 start_codon:yes stop_codon:yes gene_type:complete
MLKNKPKWLRAKLPTSAEYKKTLLTVNEHKLNTVCKSAQCPNMGECWSRGTATVMILGNICTRSCSFCAIQTGRPTELDIGEPSRVADSIAKMNLKHAVITSVARDDLKDGGASIWANTIRAVHNRIPECAVEVLTADFRGQQEYLDIVLDACPDIFNHNLETVKRLQRPIRKTARYDRSLWVLEHAKSRGFITKSGIMLGIGETEDEIKTVLKDMRDVGVDILTIGQYLQPSPKHEPVDRWVTPEEFQRWKDYALEIGYGVCESGPLIRSSYHAEEQSDKFDVLNRRKTLMATL